MQFVDVGLHRLLKQKVEWLVTWNVMTFIWRHSNESIHNRHPATHTYMTYFGIAVQYCVIFDLVISKVGCIYLRGFCHFFVCLRSLCSFFFQTIQIRAAWFPLIDYIIVALCMHLRKARNLFETQWCLYRTLEMPTMVLNREKHIVWHFPWNPVVLDWLVQMSWKNTTPQYWYFLFHFLILCDHGSDWKPLFKMYIKIFKSRHQSCILTLYWYDTLPHRHHEETWTTVHISSEWYVQTYRRYSIYQPFIRVCKLKFHFPETSAIITTRF